MSDDNLDAGTMSFWDHLNELRARIIKSILAFGVGAGVAWWFRENLLLFLTRPYVEGWYVDAAELPSLHYPAPQSLFLAYIKLAMLGGAIFSMPVVLYQLWAFVAPGLYKREKRLAIPFVVSSCGLFALGAYFGWKVVFTMAFKFLSHLQEMPEGSGLEVQSTVMIGEYIEFITRALLAFGLVFEIPVIVFFLSIIGLINHRHLIRFARYFVVIAFVLGAVITPPDPISQLLLAGPLIGLYIISIGISWLVTRKPRAKAPDDPAKTSG